MKDKETMSLDEAIKHAEEVANKTNCSECSDQHRQLAEWLKELKEYRRGSKSG
jgi:hypothetical protein